VSGEVDFDTLWQESLTTALTATAQNSATSLGLHARTEPKLLFAGSLGRLISTFHLWKK
jgi:hypothetical protein